MNPPEGMIPRIPAQTGRRMLFGKMFLWRLQMGLSQSAVILDTVFDSICPEQPVFYASISELSALTAGTIKSKRTLLAARDELIMRGLAIVVKQSNDFTGNLPTLYWRFMPKWAAGAANFSTEIEKVGKICTRGSANFALPIREEIAENETGRRQIRKDKRRGECADAEASAAAPISDVHRISLERRVAELRLAIGKAVRGGQRQHAELLYEELCTHQNALGFTPDRPPSFRFTATSSGMEGTRHHDEPTEPQQEETATHVRRMVQEFKSKIHRSP
jgi:hypothetical protein